MDCCEILLNICKLCSTFWRFAYNEESVPNLYCVAFTNCRIASQLAFTMVWMLIISQLGYYKILYGPQVLLQMNIAYFLPSIPLLGLSSQFDERLDQKFGMLVNFHLQVMYAKQLAPISSSHLCRGSQDYIG